MGIVIEFTSNCCHSLNWLALTSIDGSSFYYSGVCSKCREPATFFPSQIGDLQTELGPDAKWSAWDGDTYDGAPDGNNMMGEGDTFDYAICDLLEQIEDDR